ncbi:MAG: TIGR04290 family methyltransferase [Chloroflexota bacterium]
MAATHPRDPAGYTRDEIAARITELGPWFHNMELAPGLFTNQAHFLGNYPAHKWERISSSLPADLSGKTVLDIGCNAGFHSLEMKRRGARRVLGLDHDARYVAQARFAASVLGLDVDYREMGVYDLEKLWGETWDYVLFMGVFYHLRHPLLALDLLSPLVGERLVFQSMLRGPRARIEVAEDYPFTETAIFEERGFPAMYFVEHRYAHDWTNWWVPNEAGMMAMLRSIGMRILEQPDTDVFICEPREGVHRS